MPAMDVSHRELVCFGYLAFGKARCGDLNERPESAGSIASAMSRAIARTTRSRIGVSYRGSMSSEAICMAELSESLLEAFARHAGDPDHREVVIVTVEPRRSIADVDGVTVQGTARAGTIIMGTTNERGARELAEHEGVLRIERDSGDMRALE